MPASILVCRADLAPHALDPTRAAGLWTNRLHRGLLCLVSLTIVVALEAVGIILAIAPGAVAFPLARRFGAMLAVALARSLAETYARFSIGSAPAPTIVLLMTLAFVAAFVATIGRTARDGVVRLPTPAVLCHAPPEGEWGAAWRTVNTRAASRRGG